MQTFRDFMEAALYDPEQGYYGRRIPREDFYTAPELHPAFGGVLGHGRGHRTAYPPRGLLTFCGSPP